jgi:hypothetical protein
MDMFNHGNSANYAADNAYTILVGMYQAVKMLATLPYVDTGKIGITGHSLGGWSSNTAVEEDSAAPRQLIKAVLLNCMDPIVLGEDGAFFNYYGTRHVGIVAAQYDEFFFRVPDGNGGTTVPRDFMKSPSAQAFLYFGADPAGQAPRQAETIYKSRVGGTEAIRAIYNPDIVHPWSHMSQRSTVATINFFTEAFGAPNPIPATNQIWQWKVFFNFLGLIGFGIFIVSFTICMVFTPFFASLRAKAAIKPVKVDKTGYAWFFGGLAVACLFGTLIYMPVLMGIPGHSLVKLPVAQNSTLAVSTWAALCGAFAIIMMIISYNLYGKKNGFGLKVRGVSIGLGQLGKTVLLALITVTVSYGLVFLADFFFKVDYRFWVLAVKAFTVDKVIVALFPYLFLFLVYYVANAVAVNSFNFIENGKKEWVNTAIVAVFNGIGALILVLIQYIGFRVGGEMTFGYDSNMCIIWLFPIIVILPVTAIMGRKIYRVTNNPYLPGLINGILITLISCTNTLTWG